MGRKEKKEAETPSKEEFETLRVESKSPNTAVLLLRSSEEEILIRSCEAVYRFALKGEENSASLLGLGALEPLYQLISHNNKRIRRNAFMALGTMATTGEVSNALKKTDIIPSIISKLSTEEDTVVQEFATLCLASLSKDIVCSAQIYDNQGLLPLVRLLSSPDPDVQKNALEVIINMVQDYKSQLAVPELGGTPLLLDLLKSDYPVIQQLALKTLENITVHKGAQTTFREEQGFEKIMDILSNKDFDDLHAGALQVVANCVSDSESLQLIHQMGGLTRLMQLVVNPPNPEIQLNTIKCITSVAQSSQNHEVFHKNNVEATLVELLSVEDASVKAAACLAVAAMSLHGDSRQAFRELGAIAVVMQLLKSETMALREASTMALLHLTQNDKINAFAVHEVGGHEILVQQLSDSCPRTVAHAAATLANMANYGVLRSSILSHGAVRALVEPLKSNNTQVLQNSTLCLAQLGCEAEARAELLSAGGLQPLVSLLRSNHKHVFHNTCLAVNVCASDEATVVEMCRLGALELLQEINESVDRRSSFSQLAFVGLLNYNLPVKYSLLGCLSGTDVIADGFYDAGQARAGQRVLTLEELIEQPVDQQRPVIVINAAPEVTVDEQKQDNPTQPASKGRRKTPRKKKDDEKQKEESRPESPPQTPSKLMNDVALQALVQEAKESILPLMNGEEQCSALARMVSKAMGGAVEREKLHEFPWILHLSELKFQLQSNVVPIGMISLGIYRHRALLFKCLADRIGMSCTLVRGEYNRAWNEVLVLRGDPFSQEHASQPITYIIDLMHQPGSLLKPDSPAAIQYQTI